MRGEDGKGEGYFWPTCVEGGGLFLPHMLLLLPFHMLLLLPFHKCCYRHFTCCCCCHFTLLLPPFHMLLLLPLHMLLLPPCTPAALPCTTTVISYSNCQACHACTCTLNLPHNYVICLLCYCLHLHTQAPPQLRHLPTVPLPATACTQVGVKIFLNCGICLLCIIALLLGDAALIVFVYKARGYSLEVSCWPATAPVACCCLSGLLLPQLPATASVACCCLSGLLLPQWPAAASVPAAATSAAAYMLHCGATYD